MDKNDDDLDIASFVKRARAAMNLTQEEFANVFGRTKANISGWELGRHEPSYRTICKISKKSGLPLPQMSLKGIKGSVSVEPGPDIKGKVPIISYVQAGNWSETIEFMPDDAIEWLPCPVCHSNRTFALRVRGESMYNPHKKPSFEEGDLIFVDPERQPINGSLVVARLENENEATFKKLIIDGDKKYLSALNPAWPEPIIHFDSHAKICGVVIFKGEII